jgi:aminopeptidase N
MAPAMVDIDRAIFPPIGDPGADHLFNGAVYQRGALTLHALRLEVGDEAFFEILRTYTARFAYSNATTADFIAIAEEISGQELDELFDAWLYQILIPDIPELDLYRVDFASEE